MKDKEVAYRDIIDRLSQTEPTLDDAKGLTDKIMQRVAQEETHQAKVLVIRVLGLLSGVAASILICLLVFENLKYPISPAKKGSIYRDVGSYVFTKYENTESLEGLVKRKNELRVHKVKIIEAYTVRIKTKKQPYLK